MINIIHRDERKFHKLADLARELKIPYIQAWLELEVRDGQGKVIYHHRQRSRSWVRNVYNSIISLNGGVNSNDSTFGAGLLSGKTTGGTVVYGLSPMAVNQTNNMREAGYGYIGAAGSVLNGIIAGSGIGAESFEDYKIGTIVAHGTGAGQLSYAQDEAYSYSYNTPSKTLTVTRSRYMNNNSPGNVLVSELALYGFGSASVNLYYFCVSRDKLGETITIPATGQLRVTYTIALVYPA